MTSPSPNKECRFYEGRWSPGGVYGVDRLFHFCTRKSRYIPGCGGCSLGVEDKHFFVEDDVLARHWA